MEDARLFINRELSWLAFNERVLEEAADRGLPAATRLKFLAITCNNLDEFFMVRVAGLKQQLASGLVETAADRLLPGEQLAQVSERAHAMVAEQYRLWREEIMPALAELGAAPPIAPAALDGAQLEAARVYFSTLVFPALTPLAIDPGHPFPHLRGKSINLAVKLRARDGERDSHLAVVQVPGVLGRFARLSARPGEPASVVLLEALIANHVRELFPGYVVEHTAAFRVTRNGDLQIDEEESADLLSAIQQELRRRERGVAVRLEIEAAAPDELVAQLTRVLRLEPGDVYRLDGPLQLSDLAALTDAPLRADPRIEVHTPVVPPFLADRKPMMAVIAKQDVLLHHPYESFDPVVRFIEEAAADPEVLAIKQTLYRTSGDSPIVGALNRAAQNGKQVAVLVELKARFDEANNIAWARKLENDGVHVVYGLLGLKTHCKAALVVRREGAAIKRYVHLGTGNYNPKTARLYTDVSLLTARPEIAEEVTALFNVLTGYADPPAWQQLAVAPFNLRDRVVELIEREAARARSGRPARIIAKMNALVDEVVIRALYAASQAGVEIDLVVRGICCLRPGVRGVSDRIRVRSIVDRFLEHSRVFAFGAAPQTEVYLSSADWMPRNFLRRVEILFPIEEPALRGRLLDEVLGLALADNAKARQLDEDGSYSRVRCGSPELRCQIELSQRARAAGGSELGPRRNPPREASALPLAVQKIA
jgi:polyphosphate kinase